MWNRYFFLTIALYSLACGGASQQTATSPDEGAITSLEQGAVVERLHGREVQDPFRALEYDNQLTHAWMEEQTALAEEYFAANFRPHRQQRLRELLSIGYFGSLSMGGQSLFYLQRDGGADQASLFTLRDGEEPLLLMDPNELGERVTIDWFFPSPHGNYLAYGISSHGDERSTLYVLDIQARETLPTAIPHTKWCELVWLDDESGFYYTRYPAPGEEDYDPENEDTYFNHLFFHQLGGDGSGDPLVYRANQTDWVSPHVSRDGRYLTLAIFRGWTESDLYLVDLSEPEAAPVPVVVDEEFLVWGGVYWDRLVLFSNEGHPLGRIMSAPLDDPARREGWRELVPQGEGSIEGFRVGGQRLLVNYVEDIAARLAVFDQEGEHLYDISLPTHGSVSSPVISLDGSQVAFVFSSFFHQPTIYRATEAEPQVLQQVEADIDQESYTLERAEVTSRDGTLVNVFLVHRRDMVPDGRQPVLLTGYGGFGYSDLPYFSRNVFYWLESGGVYALANIRGGGEYGEEWHLGGMRHNKPNSFDDFEAVIRWLSESGLSSPERIAIQGASNGGLLMGAMIARCPEAFRAAIASVGLFDMVRFTEFPPAEIWMSEYGDPSDPDDFEVLLGYSPYHNLRDGTHYPAALIDTALRDTRVSWQHSTKFAARLQQASGSQHPILFHMSRDLGHGAGTGLSDLVEQIVRYYTFIETELGMESQP